MPLNPTLNVNLSTSATTGNDLSPTMQTYYDKKLLRDAKPKLVHGQFAQKRNIPRNNGKTIQFRKFTPFAPAMTALTEGEPPVGNKLDISDITATVAQYGDFVALSDVVSMVALDPLVNETLSMQSDQAALTLDHLARDVLTASADATNVIYAAGSERAAIAATDVLTSTQLRKAVRTLKKNKAPMFNNGGIPHYIAIIGPDTEFDFQNDTDWKAVSTYQDKQNIYSGEIGTIFGVKIIQTTESKIFEAANILDTATNVTETATLTTISSAAYVSATPSIQVTATATQLGSAGIAALANQYIVVAGQKRKIVSAAAHATPANGTILTLDAALTGFDNNDTDLNSITVYGAGGGKTANDIAATLVLGKNAYGDIDIDGSGAMKAIVKPVGSAGVADPLDQVSTVGWKVPAYVCKILMPEWLVRIEHGFSA